MRALLLVLLGALTACGGERPARSERPDVVLIVVDTLRADKMSVYGYDRPTTPFLESIAEGGTLFEDVTAQGSWTLPSMVSLFTGRYLTAYRDVISPRVPTVPEMFAEAGYRTVGVSANILLTPKNGFARGFEHYDAAPAPKVEGDDRVHARNMTQLAPAVLAPLDEALRAGPDGTRPPLFLFIQPFDPHSEGPGVFPRYQRHERFARELPLETTPPAGPPGWQSAQVERLAPPGPLDDPDWSRALETIQLERTSYDREVRHTDERLAQLLAELDRRGVGDNAVFALVSDHGEALWERLAPYDAEKLRTLPPFELLYQEHGANVYEEAIATPFLLWGVGVPEGVRVSNPVENVDLVPTLLELADLPLPPQVHGRSLLPVARGEEVPPRELVFSNVLHGVSVREPATGLKLVIHRSPADLTERSPELYDLLDVQGVRENLTAQRPGNVARLRAAIDAWRAEYPTAGTEERELDDEERKRLGDLGYGGEHTGR
jgi:arylsulfatase A-like enzyme